MRLRSFGLYAVILALLLASLGLDDKPLADTRYCEMIDIFDQTNGKHGWAPFKGRSPCK